jgi:hypothetical protein
MYESGEEPVKQAENSPKKNKLKQAKLPALSKLLMENRGQPLQPNQHLDVYTNTRSA